MYVCIQIQRQLIFFCFWSCRGTGGYNQSGFPGCRAALKRPFRAHRRLPVTHALFGPEQAVSPELRNLLRDPRFQNRVGAIVVDECHVLRLRRPLVGGSDDGGERQEPDWVMERVSCFTLLFSFFFPFCCSVFLFSSSFFLSSSLMLSL